MLGAIAIASLVALLVLLIAACLENSVYSSAESTLRTLLGDIGTNAESTLRTLLGNIDIDMSVRPLPYFGRREGL